MRSPRMNHSLPIPTWVVSARSNTAFFVRCRWFGVLVVGKHGGGGELGTAEIFAGS